MIHLLIRVARVNMKLREKIFLFRGLNVKGRELIKLLEDNGWILDRINGSHHIMKKDDLTITVPVHNKDLKKGLLNKILKISGLK